jgi:TonB-dependent starch-binding outer membrane protein SusC
MKRLMLMLLCVAFAGMQVFAQGVTVTGKATDANGEAMPGVTIQVKGTTAGTVTQADGTYRLSVPADATTLVFSFVGMKTQELEIGGRAVIDVVLEEEVTALSEIVVVGYATQTKASVTGAVAQVDNADMNTQSSSNVMTRIQGKASGVTVQNSHTPGGDATVIIRGLGTINNNVPLYVIDGVPTKYGIGQLNPNEIESISVLKDAASAAIYGARGANGVIIVTTKRGTSGKPSISFTARVGTQKASNKYDLLNTAEYGELLWLEDDNMGQAHGVTNPQYGDGDAPDIPDYIMPTRGVEGSPEVDPALYDYAPANEDGDGLYLIVRANQEGTDWYDEIYQNGLVQEYNLSISGGSQAGTYAFTMGYNDEEGILIHTGFRRYSLRSNADTKVNNWLTLGESLGLSYTHGYGNRGDNGEGTPISQAYRMQPIIPVYDIMGNYAGTKATGTSNGENAVAVLTRDKDDFGNDLRGIGNIYADFTLIKDLHFKSMFGFDYRQYNGRDIFRKNPEFQEAKPTDQLTMSSNYTIQWNFTNTLTYAKTVADVHKFNILLGTEAVSSDYRWYNAARSTYFLDDPDYMQLNSGEKDQSNSGNASEWSTMSYFGRLNYDLMGKYLLEATFRRDGSSRFGANNRWGNFPAFSLGWRISEESFMSFSKSWLSYLKVRGGWGVSGNDEIGDYNGFTTYSSDNKFSYYSITGNPNGTTAGFDSQAIGNPDAKWETTKTTNVGVDATFLNNTLSVTFDIWQRNTTDMLYQVAIPAINGYADAPSINIGDMSNNGYDIEVGYNNKAMGGDFRYGIALNFSHYKNKIEKLSGVGGESIGGTELRQYAYTRAEVGTAYPEFYGLICDGIYQTQDEVDNSAQLSGYSMPGHLKFRDVSGPDGTPDGIIDDDDRTYIGSPHPDFTSGLTIDLGYKNFSLNAFFYASYGNEMMNYVRRWIDYTNFGGNRSKDRLYKSWGSPYLADNADAKLTMADYAGQTQRSSTHLLEDASFLRMKSLQLGYTIPTSVTNKAGIGNLEVYLQGSNLFTITKYSGLDPEVRTSGIDMGIDQGAWPTARAFMVGVKLDL